MWSERMRAGFDIGQQIDHLAEDVLRYRRLPAQPAEEIGGRNFEEAAQLHLAAQSLSGLAQSASLERVGHTPSFAACRAATSR